MKKQKDLVKYSGLSFEEFLLDDFFVASNLCPTEESVLFWEQFEQDNKECLDHYLAAKKCLRDINKDLLKPHQVATMWERIKTSNRPVKSKRYQYLYIGLTAACIAMLFIIKNLHHRDIVSPHEDIIAFANKTMTVADPTATQLILSDHQTVSLPEQESVIVYDSASIKTGAHEILKEETSTYNQLIIPKGKRSFLTLHDGTKIWANSGTKIIYPVKFEQNKREIYVDGEVYLNVVAKNDQPFLVRTGDMDVQVLGTEFNVEAYASDSKKRVVLKSGAVTIHPNGNSKDIVLHPNQMYERNGSNGQVVSVDVCKYTSWINGVYIYENERLDVILKRLSRYYGIEITVDTTAAQLKCSGKLDLKENLKDVMKIIQYIAPIRCEYKSGQSIYVTYHKL